MPDLIDTPNWLLLPGIILGALAALVCALVAAILLAVEVSEWAHVRATRRRIAEHLRQDALTAQVEGVALIEQELTVTTDCEGNPFDEAAWREQWGIPDAKWDIAL
jgi:hypothetical protein